MSHMLMPSDVMNPSSSSHYSIVHHRPSSSLPAHLVPLGPMTISTITITIRSSSSLSIIGVLSFTISIPVSTIPNTKLVERILGPRGKRINMISSANGCTIRVSGRGMIDAYKVVDTTSTDVNIDVTEASARSTGRKKDIAQAVSDIIKLLEHVIPQCEEQIKSDNRKRDDATAIELAYKVDNLTLSHSTPSSLSSSSLSSSSLSSSSITYPLTWHSAIRDVFLYQPSQSIQLSMLDDEYLQYHFESFQSSTCQETVTLQEVIRANECELYDIEYNGGETKVTIITQQERTRTIEKTDDRIAARIGEPSDDEDDNANDQDGEGASSSVVPSSFDYRTHIARILSSIMLVFSSSTPSAPSASMLGLRVTTLGPRYKILHNISFARDIAPMNCKMLDFVREHAKGELHISDQSHPSGAWIQPMNKREKQQHALLAAAPIIHQLVPTPAVPLHPSSNPASYSNLRILPASHPSFAPASDAIILAALLAVFASHPSGIRTSQTGPLFELYHRVTWTTFIAPLDEKIGSFIDRCASHALTRGERDHPAGALITRKHDHASDADKSRVVKSQPPLQAPSAQLSSSLSSDDIIHAHLISILPSDGTPMILSLVGQYLSLRLGRSLAVYTNSSLTLRSWIENHAQHFAITTAQIKSSIQHMIAIRKTPMMNQQSSSIQSSSSHMPLTHHSHSASSHISASAQRENDNHIAMLKQYEQQQLQNQQQTARNAASATVSSSIAPSSSMTPSPLHIPRPAIVAAAPAPVAVAAPLPPADPSQHDSWWSSLHISQQRAYYAKHYPDIDPTNFAPAASAHAATVAPVVATVPLPIVATPVPVPVAASAPVAASSSSSAAPCGPYCEECGVRASTMTSKWCKVCGAKL